MKEIIINHEETRMVTDGDDSQGLQTTKLKKIGLIFPDAQIVTVPLRTSARSI